MTSLLYFLLFLTFSYYSLCLFVCLFVSKEALHIWWTISHRQGNGMGTHDLGGMRISATAWELVCFSLFFFFHGFV